MMKRMFLMLITLAIIVSMLCSCSKTYDDFDYKVILVNYSYCDSTDNLPNNEYDNSEDEAYIKKHIPIWSDNYFTYEDDSVSEEMEITFNGKQYKGKYSDTSAVPPSVTETHYYIEKGVSFSVDGEGNLLSIYLGEAEYDFFLEIDMEQCRQISDGIAKEYISLDEYEVTVSKEEYGYKNVLYTFDYKRNLGEYDNVDYITVEVCGNGEICNFQKGEIGSLSKIEAVEADEKRCEQAIQEKVNEIFGTGDVEYEVEYRYFIKLDGNNYGFLYEIYAHCLDDSSNHCGSYLTLLLV